MEGSGPRTTRLPRKQNGGRSGGSLESNRDPGEPGGGNSEELGGQDGRNDQSTATVGTDSGEGFQGSGTQTGAEEKQPDPRVLRKIPVRGRPRGKGTPRTTRSGLSELTLKTSTSIVVFTTAVIARFFGPKWYPDAEEVETLGDALLTTVEPYPIVGHFLATWGAPAILGGASIMYANRRLWTKGPGVGISQPPSTLPTPQPRQAQQQAQPQAQPTPQAQPAQQPVATGDDPFKRPFATNGLVSRIDN